MLNKLRKLSIVIIMLFSLVLNVQLPVRAATASKHFLNNISYSVMKNGITAYGPGFTLTMDNEVVFCVDPMTEVNAGNGYSEEYFSHGLAKDMSVIVYEGYYKHRNNSDADYWRFAANMMIWEKMGWTTKEVTGFHYEGYKSQIETAIVQHNERPSFHNTNITINSGESVTLTDTNNVLQEFTFQSSGGLLVSKNGNQLTINATNESNDKEKVLFHKIPDACVGTSIIYRKQNSQDIVKFYVEDPIPAVVNVTVNKRGHIEIAKRDEDGNYVPNTTFRLAYNNDMENPIGTYTTGANGKVIVENLLAQRVYIQEISVPSHLILDPMIQSVSIVPNTTTTYVANNYWKQGKVRIIKKDKQSDKVVQVEGAKYDIFKEDGTKVSTITSDHEGYATSGLLRYGNYYYIEQLAPENYQLNPERHPFVIDKDTSEQEFINSIIYDDRVKGKTTITKEFQEYDHAGTGDAKIDGAVYGLYTWDTIVDPADQSVVYPRNTLISTHIIKDGKATAEVDYLGEYYWQEMPDQASEGCMVDTEKHKVVFNYEGQLVPVVIKDTVSKEPIKMQAFQIQKLEDPNQNGESMPLGKAEFSVKLKSDVDKVGWDQAIQYDKLITDDLGSATSRPLPYGIYIVKETKTPNDQYEPVADFTITISEHSTIPQTYRYFIDSVFKTKLAVYKKDSETNKIIPLTGMKFKIKVLSKTADFEVGEYVHYWQWFPLPKLVDTWETTEEGFVFLEEKLRAGEYQIEEIESPYGYLLNHEPLKFTVEKGWHEQMGPDNDTIITTISFQDHPVKGQVNLDKIGEIFQGYTKTQTQFGELYTPFYERDRMADVIFEIKAKTDIIGADGTVWYRSGQHVTTMTTDGLHVTKSPLLPLGIEGYNQYTLQEIETNNGYVLDDTVRTFYFQYEDENTPIVGATFIDGDGNKLPFEDVILLENKKETSVILATKHLEESIFGSNGSAYTDIIFGVFSKNVRGLEEDSLVGISHVNLAGEFYFSLSQEGNYYMKELQTNPNYELNEERYPFTFTYQGEQVQKIYIHDKEPIENRIKRTSLEIYKLDEDTRRPLKDVYFELAIDQECKHILQVKSTDVFGKLLFDGLEVNQTYYVRERYDGNSDMVSKGYVYDPTVHEIHTENIEVKKLNVTNRQVKGKVQFTKTGEAFQKAEIIQGQFGLEYHPIWAKSNLLGAELTIEANEDIMTWDGTHYYQKGEIITKLPSDWSIMDSLILPVGNYKAYESKTPDGYRQDKTEYLFKIVANGKEEIQLQPFTIHNEREKIQLQFHKDMELQTIFKNEHAYKDVIFGLYAREDITNYQGEVAIKADSLLGISHIHANGQLVNDFDLPQGKYYFKELQTNAQYQLDPKKYVFDIKIAQEDDNIVTINEGNSIVNHLAKGKIELHKYTKDQVYLSYQERMGLKELNDNVTLDHFGKLPEPSKHALPCVTFELAIDKDFKNIIQSKTTNTAGYLSFDDLELGTYYIREKSALDFYELNEEVFEVVLETHQQIETIEIENTLKKYDVFIKKVDANDPSLVLEHAIFTMYRDEACTEVLETAESNEQGMVQFHNISYGMDVYIKETQAPKGYQLSQVVVHLKLDENWLNQPDDTKIIVYENEKLEPPVETGDGSDLLIHSLFFASSLIVMMWMQRILIFHKKME